jgi:hypothetical protein
VFFEGISGAKAVLAEEERFRMLFLFPCRNGSLINVVAHHVDDRNQDQHGAGLRLIIRDCFDP